MPSLQCIFLIGSNPSYIFSPFVYGANHHLVPLVTMVSCPTIGNMIHAVSRTWYSRLEVMYLIVNDRWSGLDCLHHYSYHCGGHVCIASSEYGSRPLTNIFGYASVQYTRCDSHARGSTFRTLCRSNVRGLFSSLMYTLLLHASHMMVVVSWWLTHQQSHGALLR